MLTFVESISLAGDRAKQNDDAACALARGAWIIDGATDLGAPLTHAASDASWLASALNQTLFELSAEHDEDGATELQMRENLRTASMRADIDFRRFAGADTAPRWQSPTASALLVSDHDGRLIGVELGDCRCFVVGADGAVHAVGGPPNAADDEQRAAARAGQTANAAALLRDAGTMERLRAIRATHNTLGGYAVFGLQPDCGSLARTWSLTPARPAHILLMTDGFAALADRYGAYDAGGLVVAALEKGLHELARELRAIETADAGGAKHPRFKASDDATALLLRLS
jgi:hypothetical protein